MLKTLARKTGFMRPLTPPGQRDADRLYDATLINYDKERGEDRVSGKSRVRSASPRGVHQKAREAEREAEFKNGPNVFQRASNYLWPNPNLKCYQCESDAIVGGRDEDNDAAAVSAACGHIYHRSCFNQRIAESRARGNTVVYCFCGMPAMPITTVVPARHTNILQRSANFLWPRQPGLGGFKNNYNIKGRRTRSKSKSRRCPRKPCKTRKV